VPLGAAAEEPGWPAWAIPLRLPHWFRTPAAWGAARLGGKATQAVQLGRQTDEPGENNMAEKRLLTSEGPPAQSRSDHELPVAVAKWGWRFHHMGIPTNIPRPGEQYLEHLKMYVSGFESSPYGIEWMRFEPDSPTSELVRTVPHVAFVVDDLDAELEGKEVWLEPTAISDGGRVAMIIDDGAPVELLEFRKESAKIKD